jgi:hypothetical protein
LAWIAWHADDLVFIADRASILIYIDRSRTTRVFRRSSITVPGWRVWMVAVLDGDVLAWSGAHQSLVVILRETLVHTLVPGIGRIIVSLRTRLWCLLLVNAPSRFIVTLIALALGSAHGRSAKKRLVASNTHVSVVS